jgi:hypothetical protein
MRTSNVERRVLAAVVILHLGVSALHGRAHQEAQVGLSSLATQFVYIVILAAPLAGLGALLLVSRLAGAWIVTISMAAAFIFGLVNHFILQSPDHVNQVSGAWASTFAATAVLLAITEAAGSLLAVRQALFFRRLS